MTIPFATDVEGLKRFLERNFISRTPLSSHLGEASRQRVGGPCYLTVLDVKGRSLTRFREGRRWEHECHYGRGGEGLFFYADDGEEVDFGGHVGDFDFWG